MVAGSSRLVCPTELESLLHELKRSAVGGGDGLLGANSVSWKVNRESALFLAAGRATLLQLAHPWIAAAIAEHSRTMRDPIGRFHQTVRVMFTMSFGSTEQALAAARCLHQRHSGIRGKLPERAGPFAEGSGYEANDVAALRWVYATLMDSALLAYELVLPPLSIAEREQYYAEGRATAALFGIPHEELPRNWQEFSVYFKSMLQSSTVVVSTAARDMAHQLYGGAGTWVRPPFWYRALTTQMLPPRLRDEFQLSYGVREQRSTARALRWLPPVYRALPPAARFVGPYLEAQAKLQGKSRPNMAVRLSNRLWTGESSLFVSAQ